MSNPFTFGESGFGQDSFGQSTTGSQADMLNRLQLLMPQGWFSPGLVPIRDAVLTGIANVFAFIYSLFAYVNLQTRIATSTDGFLDLIAQDFFGSNLIRSPGQSDANFLAQIKANILLEKATRPAIVNALTALTGTAPSIVEPNFPQDTGGYGVACGYGAAGAYGSQQLPFQAFVTVYVSGAKSGPLSGASPYTKPYGASAAIGAGGYGIGALEYASESWLGTVTPAQIYQTIASVIPEGTIAWTRIEY